MVPNNSYLQNYFIICFYQITEVLDSMILNIHNYPESKKWQEVEVTGGPESKHDIQIADNSHVKIV